MQALFGLDFAVFNSYMFCNLLLGTRFLLFPRFWFLGGGLVIIFAIILGFIASVAKNGDGIKYHTPTAHNLVPVGPLRCCCGKSESRLVTTVNGDSLLPHTTH